MKKIHLVFGGGGFIGSNLIKVLLKEKNVEIIVFDNFSNGSENYLKDMLILSNFHLIHENILNLSPANDIFKKIQDRSSEVEIWHLAANSDILTGVKDIQVDLSNTFLTTVRIIEIMEMNNFCTLNFASSSAIYGDHDGKLLREDIGNCNPISNYGAMKLASEAIISAGCEKFIKNAYIFRFPNVVGVPATHGVIYDFINKLLKDNSKLNVLGNGKQCKPYLHCSSLIEAMLHIRKYAPKDKKLNIFNIGPSDHGVQVSQIVEVVVSLFTPRPEIFYEKKAKGWVGDVPRFNYSTKKLSALGWNKKISSLEAIKIASLEIFSQLKDNK